MVADVDNVLDARIDDFEPPKPPPEGFYTFMVAQPEPKTVNTEDGEVTQAVLTSTILAADPSVDKAAVEAAGGMDVLRQRQVRLTFWLRPTQVWVFKKFAKEILGLDTKGKTLSQVIAETKGRRFKGEISHRLSEDGQVFADITNKLGKLLAA